MHPPKEFHVQFKVDYGTFSILLKLRDQTGQKSHHLAARAIVEQFSAALEDSPPDPRSPEGELTALERDLGRILERIAALRLATRTTGAALRSSGFNGHAARSGSRMPPTVRPLHSSREG